MALAGRKLPCVLLAFAALVTTTRGASADTIEESSSRHRYSSSLALKFKGCSARGCESDQVGMLQSVRTPATSELRTRARVIFYAGLEGSGHHLLGALHERLRKRLHLQDLGGVDDILPGLGCNQVEYDSRHFVALRAKLAKLDSSSLYTLPKALSYPHCGLKARTQRRKVLHPNAKFLAEAADQEGVEFQILFLYRPIVESLVAGCINRHFESCTPYVKTLISNTNFLIQDLEAVGLERVHCFRFGNLDSMARAVDAVYGPGLQSREALERTFNKSTATNGSAVWESMRKFVGESRLAQLHVADDRLQQVCRATE